MRKLLAHAFSDAALSQQEELITPYFDLLISRLQELITESPHSEVDMVKWYNFTTFDMIGDLSFGEPFHSLENGEYHSWIVNIFKAIKFARFLRLARAYPPLEYVLRTLMGRISSIGKSRKKNIAYSHTKASNRLDTKTDRKDLISYILRHNDERGMSRAEILNTATILIAAGSETTATLLSGCTYHLLKNPHALAKVKAEIRTTFKSKSDITFKSTGQLPYLHAVLEESLRLYPPFPGQLVRRTRPEGDVIAGHFVPGNVRPLFNPVEYGILSTTRLSWAFTSGQPTKTKRISTTRKILYRSVGWSSRQRSTRMMIRQHCKPSPMGRVTASARSKLNI